MVADQAVLSSWRSVVGSLEDDARVSARLMGFVYLAQPQGLIGNTLLLAVPNETTRETLQGTQVADALTDALTQEFREEILLAISIDANLQPPRTPSSEARRSSLAGGPSGAAAPDGPPAREERRASEEGVRGGCRFASIEMASRISSRNSWVRASVRASATWVPWSVSRVVSFGTASRSVLPMRPCGWAR